MLAPGRRRPPLLSGRGYFVAYPTSVAGADTTVTGTDAGLAGAFAAAVEADLPLAAFAASSCSLRLDFLGWVDAVPFSEPTIADAEGLSTAGLADLESSNSKKYPELLFLEAELDTPSIAGVFLPKSPPRKPKMPPTKFLMRLIMPLMKITPDVSNALRRGVKIYKTCGIKSDRQLSQKILLNNFI